MPSTGPILAGVSVSRDSPLPDALLTGGILITDVGRAGRDTLVVEEQLGPGAGINTGIIRSMGSTGTVVTAAGLVFAFTMGAMISGDLLNVGQGGVTIGIGLLLDTLIVRSLMTPSIAAILGPWLWWPLKVRSRPSYSERMQHVTTRNAVFEDIFNPDQHRRDDRDGAPEGELAPSGAR